MRIIHTADWHLSSRKDLQDKARNSLEQIKNYCSTNDVDGIIIAGDMWDRIQTFGNDSGVVLGYNYLRSFSKLVKFIFIIKGNPSHDAVHSIGLLNGLEKNIFACEANASLGIDLNGERIFTNLFGSEYAAKYDLIIHGISYPTKANLLHGISIDEQNYNFARTFSEMLELHGIISDDFFNTFKITVFHGNISGARLSNGQYLIGQDIVIPIADLEKTKSDYYCLGHIHLPQNITDRMRYCGSLYNKNFGEMEQKYFDVLSTDGREIEIENIPIISSRPMIIVDGKFNHGKFTYEKNIPENAEVKFRYTIEENEIPLLPVQYVESLKKEFGEDVRIEGIVIPTERLTRSQAIMDSRDLFDEVIEYAKIVNESVPESLKQKVEEIEKLKGENQNESIKT